jgi:hypothetical protein
MNNPLLKKFQLGMDTSILLINAPIGAVRLFDNTTITLENAGNNVYGLVIIFVQNEQEIMQFLPTAVTYRKEKGLLWLSYPKKSGSISSELRRDTVMQTVSKFGLEPVRLISVNENWSSMRLKNTSDRSEPSKFGQDPPGVDRATKTVRPPDDFLAEFKKNPVAAAFFENIAFSHKREYMGWIYDAKKAATRQRRIHKIIELLNNHKKTK